MSVCECTIDTTISVIAENSTQELESEFKQELETTITPATGIATSTLVTIAVLGALLFCLVFGASWYFYQNNSSGPTEPKNKTSEEKVFLKKTTKKSDEDDVFL